MQHRQSAGRLGGGGKDTFVAIAAFSPENRTAVRCPSQCIALPIAACCIRHRSALHFGRLIIVQNMLPSSDVRILLLKGLVGNCRVTVCVAWAGWGEGASQGFLVLFDGFCFLVRRKNSRQLLKSFLNCRPMPCVVSDDWMKYRSLV